jgi:hypothetical protein
MILIQIQSTLQTRKWVAINLFLLVNNNDTTTASPFLPTFGFLFGKQVGLEYQKIYSNLSKP